MMGTDLVATCQVWYKVGPKNNDGRKYCKTAVLLPFQVTRCWIKLRMDADFLIYLAS